ncbi:MAG: NADH-quinone oxidoreductase subunit NuoE [Fibrobacterota bacterium]
MEVKEEIKRDFSGLDSFIEEHKDKENPDSYLIAVLHKAQEIYGYLPVDVMDHVAVKMGIPTAHIWGVATFYHYFSLKPRGKHMISVCMGTACFVKGADRVLDALKDGLKIDVGETTEDGLFTLEATRCLGACGLAPVVMIDDKVYGGLTPRKIPPLIKKYRKEKKDDNS